MSHGIYTALSGAMSEERALENISDGLANVNTNGFKGSHIVFKEQLGQLTSELGPKDHPHVQVSVEDTVLDLTQGALLQTGRPLDVALTGPGFFAVKTPEGNALTRQGDWHLTDAGELTTRQGFGVLGHKGVIHLPKSSDVRIDGQGAVFANGAFVDHLLRLDVKGPSEITRRGDALFATNKDVRARSVTTPVESGCLEKSNVNSVAAMTQLIGVHRAYESHHRALETYRAMGQKTNSELG